MQEFFLADEKHQSIDGNTVDITGVLYFKQDKSGYVGKATKDHVDQYPAEFQAFQEKYPDYVLPESFTTPDLEIGAPVVTPQPPPEVEPPVDGEAQGTNPEAEAKEKLKPRREEPYPPEQPELPRPPGERPEIDPPEASQLPAEEDSWPHKKNI